MIVSNNDDDDDDDSGGGGGGDEVKVDVDNNKKSIMITEAVKRLRRKVSGVGTTVIAVGKDKGKWLRERNELVNKLDLSKDGIWICEGKVCREARVDEF